MTILCMFCGCSSVDKGIKWQIKAMILLACRAGLQEHLSHCAMPTVTGWPHLSKWLGTICWLSLIQALLKKKQQNSCSTLQTAVKQNACCFATMFCLLKGTDILSGDEALTVHTRNKNLCHICLTSFQHAQKAIITI